LGEERISTTAAPEVYVINFFEGEKVWKLKEMLCKKKNLSKKTPSKKRGLGQDRSV
jgi:hypothetical protein